MAQAKTDRFPLIVTAILAVAAGLVLTLYGWLPAISAVYPLFLASLWATVIGVACWGAGSLCARWLFASDDLGLEHVIITLTLGTAVLIACAGLLALVHLAYPSLLLIVLTGWTCRGAVLLSRLRPEWSADRSWQELPPALIFLGASALTLIAATSFAPFYDQWNYHLAFPYQWLRAGTVVTYPLHGFSFMPANSGLLYLYSLAGPGPWGAQVSHWWFGFLAAGGSAAVAKQLGARSFGRLLAAVVLTATPAFVQLGALAGSDLGVAAFGIGGLIALLEMYRNQDRSLRWIVTAGLLAGFSAGCKYTAIGQFVIPLACMGVLLVFADQAAPSRLRRVGIHALAFGLAVGLSFGPWLLRNALLTGNPVHPYLQALFQTLGVDRDETEVAEKIGDFEIGPEKINQGLSLGTFSRRGHAGDIGPIHLWLLPLALFWVWRRHREPRVWAVFGVFVLSLFFWAIGPTLGRYLVPTLAVLSALVGAAWNDLIPQLNRVSRGVFSIALYVLLIANCSPYRAEYLQSQLECAFGVRDEQEFLSLRVTSYEPNLAANEQLPAAAKVLLVGEPRAYGIDRDVIVEDGFREPLLVTLAQNSETSQQIAEHLEGLGVTHILWNQAEATRLAEAGGRAEYLECPTEEARQRLDRFLADHTRPFADGRWWEIRSLVKE